MQYPELNIGEFASRHSADIELEANENDEGYLVLVDVEPRETEEGYQVTIGARPETIEEVADLYKNQFADFPSDELVTVYGNNKTAVDSMRGSDSWGRFEASDEIEDSNESKGWAVNIEPLIRGMKENQYQEIMEEINASTLYAVDRAESHGEVGTGLHEFHRDLVREFMPGETEPIVIDVVEESETESEYVKLDEEEPVESSEGSDLLSESEIVETSDELERSEAETEFDYDELVSGTISKSKSRIEELEDELDAEDWKALLEAEKEGEDRVTFKPYLEERLEEEREDT